MSTKKTKVGASLILMLLIVGMLVMIGCDSVTDVTDNTESPAWPDNALPTVDVSIGGQFTITAGTPTGHPIPTVAYYHMLTTDPMTPPPAASDLGNEESWITAGFTKVDAGKAYTVNAGEYDFYAVATNTQESVGTGRKTFTIAFAYPELTNKELGDRWAFFSVKYEDAQYRFGVKPATEGAPSKSEMESDLNVKTYEVGINPINIILATTMGSPLLPFFNGATDDASAQAMWTDTDVGFADTNIMTSPNEFAARESLLSPTTAYKIYGLKDGETTVEMIHEFTTAAIDLTTATTGLVFLPTQLTAETVTFHFDNYEVFPLQLTAPLSSNTAILPLMKGEPNYTIYSNAGKQTINPLIFPKTHPEFYFYAGEAADYNNSPRLLSLRGLFMVMKEGSVGNNIFPVSFSVAGLGEMPLTPTINYQQ